jgi:hypothetical protein
MIQKIIAAISTCVTGGVNQAGDNQDDDRQEARPNETANIAPGDAFTLGQILERSGAAGGELLKPRAPARNRCRHRLLDLF